MDAAWQMGLFEQTLFTSGVLQGFNLGEGDNIRPNESFQ